MTQAVKRAWILLAFIKLLVSTNLIHYLCTKTMDKNTIVEMMECVSCKILQSYILTFLHSAFP